MEDQKQAMRDYVARWQVDIEAIFTRMLEVQPENPDEFVIRSLRDLDESGKKGQTKYAGAGAEPEPSLADIGPAIDFAAQMRAYITKRQSLFEDAFVALMKEQPSNPYAFLADALEKARSS